LVHEQLSVFGQTHAIGLLIGFEGDGKLGNGESFARSDLTFDTRISTGCGHASGKKNAKGQEERKIPFHRLPLLYSSAM
jgi:hypothetical protein